ncbi:MAG: S8 family serine peptidase [Ginsengibacter sp.]
MIIGFKEILLAGLITASFPVSSFAQNSEVAKIDTKVAPNNWYQLDRASTGYYGISLDKAYDFLKGKKSKTVIVAVIDSGIDTLQEDLKPILWVNPGEIPNNGIDDDHNGYVDDVHGWNFLGGKDGKNVKEDSEEGARLYWKLKNKFGDNIPDTSQLMGEDKKEAITFLKAKAYITKGVDPGEILMLRNMLPQLQEGDSIIAKDLGKTEFTGNDLKGYTSSNMMAKRAAAMYLGMADANKNYDISNTDILSYFKGQVRKADFAETPPKDFRGEIVKDNYNDFNDRYYGNTDLMTGSPMHGTHCSGIIAAVRNNGKGINGIADNVRIMMVRAVPDGDEHDKDIALAIRYAVDNGAQVISMSFGKGFSPEKQWVDDAVKYAESKGVLLVHAAGNDAQNVDSTDNFPNPDLIKENEKAPNFLTVGASGDATNGGFTASFSNYGKESVDVFAPGVNIYSTLPGGNKYGNASGTSMAAPVVAGVAALVLEYFPNLSAEQLRYVIMKSAVPVTEKVILPGTQSPAPGKEPTMVNLSDISVSGGELNAYEAVKLASTLKGERKEVTLPKGQVRKEKRG